MSNGNQRLTPEANTSVELSHQFGITQKTALMFKYKVQSVMGRIAPRKLQGDVGIGFFDIQTEREDDFYWLIRRSKLRILVAVEVKSRIVVKAISQIVDGIKPDFVRFRSLSDNIILPFSESMLDECQILLDDFSKLDESFLHKIKNIFIVENEMVYLTFPRCKDSICIWGQGYKVNILNGIEWFKSKELHYFGDLDEHGFDILSTYRRRYPQIQSFCMDKKILEEYRQFLVDGKKLENERIPENLTEAEKECFMILRGVKSEKNRLEQERISVAYITKQLSVL